MLAAALSNALGMKNTNKGVGKHVNVYRAAKGQGDYRRCERKKRYSSYDEGMVQVKFMQSLKLRDAEMLVVYDCDLCHGMHVGNSFELKG